MNDTLKTISRLTSLMKWSIKMLFITIVRIRFKQGGRGCGCGARDCVQPSDETVLRVIEKMRDTSILLKEVFCPI